MGYQSPASAGLLVCADPYTAICARFPQKLLDVRLSTPASLLQSSIVHLIAVWARGLHVHVYYAGDAEGRAPTARSLSSTVGYRSVRTRAVGFMRQDRTTD